MSGKHWTWLSVTALFAGFASVGVTPFCAPGCGPSLVVDPVTGASRPATPADVYAQLQPTEEAAGAVATAVGHPEWYLLGDLVARFASMLVAMYGAWKIPAPVGPQPQPSGNGGVPPVPQPVGAGPVGAPGQAVPAGAGAVGPDVQAAIIAAVQAAVGSQAAGAARPAGAV